MSTALHQQVIVGGRMMAGGGAPIEVRFPHTGERVSWFSGVSAKVMDDAIVGALLAFEQFRQVPAHARARLLRAAAARLEERLGSLAVEVMHGSGKPIREARLECAEAVATFRLAAEEATRIDGEIVPLDGVEAGAGRMGEVRRFPIGPVAAITPFPSPLATVAEAVAAALAAGNPVLVKPSPNGALSALSVGRAVLEAASEYQLPPGVISVVPCADEQVEPLVTDPRVRVLSFTGSSRVGWALRALAGRKHVILQLGGNGAVIVHSDADIERAAGRCAHGAFLGAGQLCTSVQRVYAHESLADALMRRLVAHAEERRCGDPRQEETELGPMRSEHDAARAAQWIDEAVSEGARVLCGGTHEGPLFRPTVVTGTQRHQRIVCEELLAPIVVVERYSALTEAIDATNASEYGLQAGFFSNDLAAVQRAYRDLDVGAVIVNDIGGWRIDRMPFGGAKGSGLGRGGVRSAIREQTERRLLVVDTNPSSESGDAPW